jgi:outer membrane receptor protein involved in Fe transport
VNSYLLGPENTFGTSQVVDRDNDINIHIGIPHKNGTKDDIQILGMVNFLRTYYYDSTNDLGGAAFLQDVGYTSGLGVPYTDGLQFASKTGVFLPSNYQSLISNYLYPSSSSNRAVGSAIPVGQEDNTENEQGILKVQYTHPFSQDALVKLYGYTYYSDWLQNGPQSAYADFFGPSSPDYELSSHTRGLSGSLIDQINSKNLVQLQGSYTTSSALRDNNTEMFDGGGSRAIIAYVVDSSNPTNGLCYAANGGPALSCASGSGAAIATLQQAQAGTITPATGTCGGGPCQYLVTGNGQYATYNTVTPKFTSASLTDDFHPTSKLAINGGLRMDIYQYEGSNTTGTAARTFFYNAFNADNCLDSTNSLVPISPGAGCPTGDRPADFVNPTGIVTESYTAFQPRLGATYSLDPTTVLRASYGRYTQAPNSAFQQYNTLQQNAPATLYGTYGFQKFGFDSPDHTVRPPASNNYDFSLEKSLPGQISLKLSPFYRKTQDQIQQFFLNQQTGFVSGLNVGRQTSRGIEFELDKGDFNRDGLAAKVSFTYTNSYINYNTTASGTTVIGGINSDIATYNSYTSACAPGGKLTGKTQFGQPLCGASTTGTAQACYTSTIDSSCVANPYYNAPAQALLDPNANYATYDTFPAGVGSAVNGYGAPYQGSIILNYKKGPLAITPIIQISGGQRYGAPESTYGVVPGTCGELAGATTTAGDPRYTYGSSAGLPFDALTCTNGLSIPDPYTKTFDGIGAFVAPGIAQLHLQVSYDVSKNLTLTANAANLFTTCFGSTKEPFNVAGACGYSVVAGGSTGDVGNQYNPGAAIQPYLNTPYEPTFAPNPFSIYVNAKFKM